MVNDGWQGFPSEVDLCGDNLSKMAKNCMKITKSTFLGQNSWGVWGVQANFSASGGGSPQSLPIRH